jgi:hypothetical protein
MNKPTALPVRVLLRRIQHRNALYYSVRKNKTMLLPLSPQLVELPVLALVVEPVVAVAFVVADPSGTNSGRS